MTNILLAWNAFPAPQGTNHYAHDLSNPDAVVRLFKQASHFRAHVTAQGWRFFFAEFGIEGLLEINRRAGWLDAQDDRETAEQLVSRSLIAGYDPVSQTLRGYIERIEPLASIEN